MYRTLLLAAFGLMLALGLAAAGLAWWGASETGRQVTRTRLAHAVLEGELRLKAETYAMLRRMADALRQPGERGFDLPAERAAILSALASVRDAVSEELEFRGGGSDGAELARLAQLEQGLIEVLARWRDAAALVAAGRPAEGRANFLEARSIILDGEFGDLIDQGVAEEQVETAEAYEVAAAELGQVIHAARLGGLGAAVLAIGSLLLLLRRLRRPLDELSEAATAVARGELSRRVRIRRRRDEFTRVALAFNAMMEEVERSRATLEEGRRTLEAAVAERTAALAASNARLEQADRVRRRFLADVSHELRTPLTVIRGEAEVALRRDERSPSEYRAALSIVADQAAHTARLVDDLLFVARAEAGEPRLALRPVDLDSVVRQAMADLRSLAAKAGIALDLTVESVSPVLGDIGRLRQVATVLIENALRYSDAGSVVDLRLRSGGGRVLFEVADRGLGLTEEEIGHVFDRFWRGPAAAARHAAGAGLGLPLARSIARAHEGEVTLERRPGRGCVARLTLPSARRLEAVA